MDRAAREPFHQGLLATVYRHALAQQEPGWRNVATCDLVPRRTYCFLKHQEIGSGTFGVVYESECQITERPHGGDSGPVSVVSKKVAVKKLRSDTNQQQIRVEVRVLTNLKDCPQAVRLYDVIGLPSTKHISELVFEHCPSMPAHELYPRLSPYDVRLCMYQLLLGLDYFHSRAIMHRDIKPGNLLIDPDTKQLKIIDFGQATFYSPRETYYSDVGSVPYKAPEMLMAAKHYHYAVDVWSAGRVLYNMLYPHGSELLKAAAPPEAARATQAAAAEAWSSAQLACIERKVGTDALERVARLYCLQGRGRRSARRPCLSWYDFVAPSLDDSEQGALRRRRVAEYLTADAQDLLSRMLEVDPALRITAGAALSHPYFSPLYPTRAPTQPAGDASLFSAF